MFYETKNNSVKLKFRLIIGFVSLLWIGCSTEQMRNITGSTPLNAYSVIQGLVTGSSVISRETNSSLSSIAFEDGTRVNFNSLENPEFDEKDRDNLKLISQIQRNTSTSEDSSILVENNISVNTNQKEPDEEGLFKGLDRIISLVTDSGIVLQTGVFNRYTASGKLHYRFAGEFPTESLRLRVLEGENVLELAMGSLSEFDEVVNVPDLDLVNSALATRMIEQTNKYKTLKNKGISSFIESMNSIIEHKIDQSLNKHLLVENISRVGVNNEGNFEIYATNYDPFKYRQPKQVQDWEKHLFHSTQEITPRGESFENTLSDDISTASPINKKLVNWVSSVSMTQLKLNKEIQLFKDLDFSSHSPIALYDSKFKLKIQFKEFLPIEYRDSLINNGVLKIQKGNRQKSLFISKIKSEFTTFSILELEVDLGPLSKDKNETLFIFLQHTFPKFRINQIAQAFFKFGLEAY